jgi:hypothetical protein
MASTSSTKHLHLVFTFPSSTLLTFPSTTFGQASWLKTMMSNLTVCSTRFLGYKLLLTDINPVFQFTSTMHTTPYPYISPSKQNLSGRAVFITGTSKGIGRATVLSFAVAGASYIAIGARSSLDSLVAELRNTANKAGFN